MSDLSNKKDWYSMSEGAIIKEIATFLKQTRLRKNYTQEQLANKAGINRSTLSEIEHGRPVSLVTFIQVLRALDQLELLDRFTEKTLVSPLQMAKLEGKKRKRASTSRMSKSKKKKLLLISSGKKK